MLSVVSTDQYGQYVRVSPTCTSPNYDTHTSQGSWPACTHVLCWHCCHAFNTPPLPMPVEYNDRQNLFRVMGTFCSWNCMAAYNRDQNKSILNRGPHALAISLFHKRMTTSTKTISPAPPRCVLKAFGGYMDIEEFRASSATNVMACLPPRCVLVSQVLHERRVSETKRTLNSKISNLDDTVDLSGGMEGKEHKYGDTLKLKRPKKEKEAKSSIKAKSMLELTLGLASAST